MGADPAPRPLRLYLAVQRETGASAVPSDADLRSWARTALRDVGGVHELTLRIVDEPESAALNAQYRHKSGATNVLSFPFEAPPGVSSRHLGDLVICAPVVAREADAQGKPAAAHWAHMVVHGVLHLLGYDHMTDAEAAEMEALETAILARLGYRDPYREAPDG